MRNLTLTFILLLFCTVTLTAQSIQEVTLLKESDITTSSHYTHVEYNGKLYVASGKQLWASDGTADGTYIIDSFISNSYFNTIRGLTVLNNILVFMANDGINGWELWVSDGTKNGTKIIDINPGTGHGICDHYLFNSYGYYNAQIAKMNGKLYFYGDDGIHGVELWVSDGTTGGTYMLKDINTSQGKGIIDTQHVRQIKVTNNNRLIFSAYDTTYGYELWVSDGTAQGTNMIQDMTIGNPPNSIGLPQKHLLSFQDKVLFSWGIFLYITDGTASNTIVLDSNLVISSREIVVLNNKAYFVSSTNHLIETDGTPSGTKKVFKFSGFYTNSLNSSRINLTLHKGYIYFTQYHWDSTNTNGIWKSDGTAGNTQLLFNLQEMPYNLTAFNDKLYFKMYDNATQTVDIWQCDGTSLGTKKVSHNLTNAPINSNLFKNYLFQLDFMINGNNLYFVHSFPDFNGGLYRIGMWPDNISETNKNNDISIYPNPTQTQAIITGTDIHEVTIKNIAGITVYQQTLDNNKATVDMRTWTPGIYIATITTQNNETTYCKLIKQ